ncbi:hypothetical protein [Falsigemmobacter faecalis]|uniref:hypothetical protein n=1 Tax=Falsigemmobacter faecalis TaxID=2488730 RepID=UPI0013159A3A|nr:hypothetical protein [Falsigemmobacter faecalis]
MVFGAVQSKKEDFMNIFPRLAIFLLRSGCAWGGAAGIAGIRGQYGCNLPAAGHDEDIDPADRLRIRPAPPAAMGLPPSAFSVTLIGCRPDGP